MRLSAAGQRTRTLLLILSLGLLLAACGGTTANAGSTGSQTFSTLAQATPGNDSWTPIRRPLHLTRLAAGAPCQQSPVHTVSPDGVAAIGDGPVYAGSVQPDGLYHLYRGPDYTEGGWRNVEVQWLVSPDYTGPVLVRGLQLDEPDELGFDIGPTPISELHLQGGTPATGGWRTWTMQTRVHGPGCYAYQVDGTNFSETIVFRVIGP